MKKRPHNYIPLDMAVLRKMYAEDHEAVRKFAEMNGVSLWTVYSRMKEVGIKVRTLSEARTGILVGKRNPNWKPDGSKRPDGYILERQDGKRIYQHRRIMEEKIGRKLRPGECVHHKNGDKSDNRPENLELYRSHAEHMKDHCDSEVMRERGRKGLESRYGKAILRARMGMEEG